MTQNRIRLALKFTMVLFEIMFLITIFWWLGSVVSSWWDSPLLRMLGIFTGVVYLFLCPVAPVCGIICGGLGYFRLKKADGELKPDEVRKWRMISVIEMILGILTAFPCMILFLGACSGQI